MISRPAWATTVGILMMLFGGCSTINHLKLARSADIDKVKYTMLNDIDAKIPTKDLDSFERSILIGSQDSLANDSIPETVDIKNVIDRLTHMTDYFKEWAAITGYAGTGIALLFIISGILFFYKKKITIPLAFVALLTSIIFAVAKIIIFKGDTSSDLLLSGMRFTFYMSIFVDMIVLIILFVSDKSYYTDEVYVDG